MMEGERQRESEGEREIKKEMTYTCITSINPCTFLPSLHFLAGILSSWVTSPSSPHRSNLLLLR